MHTAAESRTPDAQADLAGLSIEELLDIKTYSASKLAQKITEAPASVSIITATDIKGYGYSHPGRHPAQRARLCQTICRA